MRRYADLDVYPELLGLITEDEDIEFGGNGIRIRVGEPFEDHKGSGSLDANSYQDFSLPSGAKVTFILLDGLSNPDGGLAQFRIYVDGALLTEMYLQSGAPGAIVYGGSTIRIEAVTKIQWSDLVFFGIKSGVKKGFALHEYTNIGGNQECNFLHRVIIPKPVVGRKIKYAQLLGSVGPASAYGGTLLVRHIFAGIKQTEHTLDASDTTYKANLAHVGGVPWGGFIDTEKNKAEPVSIYATIATQAPKKIGIGSIENFILYASRIPARLVFPTRHIPRARFILADNYNVPDTYTDIDCKVTVPPDASKAILTLYAADPGAYFNIRSVLWSGENGISPGWFNLESDVSVAAYEVVKKVYDAAYIPQLTLQAKCSSSGNTTNVWAFLDVM